MDSWIASQVGAGRYDEERYRRGIQELGESVKEPIKISKLRSHERDESIAPIYFARTRSSPTCLFDARALSLKEGKQNKAHAGLPMFYGKRATLLVNKHRRSL